MAGKSSSGGKALQGATPEDGLAERAATPESGPETEGNEPREYTVKAPFFLDGAIRRAGERVSMRPSRARSIGTTYLQRVQVKEEEL